MEYEVCLPVVCSPSVSRINSVTFAAAWVYIYIYQRDGYGDGERERGGIKKDERNSLDKRPDGGI